MHAGRRDRITCDKVGLARNTDKETMCGRRVKRESESCEVMVVVQIC